MVNTQRRRELIISDFDKSNLSAWSPMNFQKLQGYFTACNFVAEPYELAARVSRFINIWWMMTVLCSDTITIAASSGDLWRIQSKLNCVRESDTNLGAAAVNKPKFPGIPDPGNGSSRYPDWSRSGTTSKWNGFVFLPESVLSPRLVTIYRLVCDKC